MKKFSIEKISNKDLKGLLTEINKIGRSEIPSKVKKSDLMKELFEDVDGSFYDKYSNASTIISLEIVDRFRNNLIK